VRRESALLNLAPLQRLDPNIVSVIYTSKHVVLYSLEKGQWEKQLCEGPFFIVERKSLPRYRFIILNRKTDQNLVQDLSQQVQKVIEAQDK